jgi:AcrR family transcriptional regulator
MATPLRTSGREPVARRAPFSDSPEVGPRGRRTQQRILDAALEVFGAEGYHRSSIDRIAQLGGCSRVAFYQYFEDKQDVFRQLAGQVARQLSASTEALDPLTPTVEGLEAMRRWVGRYAEIYERYQPVFNAYQMAVESGELLATFAGQAGAQHVGSIRSRVIGSTLPPRQLDPVIGLLLEGMAHTLDVASVLTSAAPGA